MTEFEHDMYSPVYRLPRGAQQTGSRVRFALGVRSERQTIESVYLCFSWGLYSFSTDSRRMLPMQHSDGNVQNFLISEPGRFSTGLGLFYGWHVEGVRHMRIWKGVSSSVPPSILSAFINGSPVHKADRSFERFTGFQNYNLRLFRTPDWFKSAVVYQFPTVMPARELDIERLKVI